MQPDTHAPLTNQCSLLASGKTALENVKRKKSLCAMLTRKSCRNEDKNRSVQTNAQKGSHAATRS